MTRLGAWLVVAYLAVFTLFARDPVDARDERRLLLGSLEDDYHRRRAAGYGSSVAMLLALWAHLGELQPIAVLTRLQAANQRAARAGIGARRVILRLAALPALAASLALIVWRADALGWILLGFVILLLAVMLWSVRHAGARWLMPLIPLFMVWPLVELRIAPGRGPDVATAVSFCLLLGAALAAHQLARWGRGNYPRWRAIATLMLLPFWWAVAKSLYAAAYWIVFPGGYAGPGSARLGLPADDAIVGVSFLYIGLTAIYWLALAFTVARVAAAFRVPASDASSN